MPGAAPQAIVIGKSGDVTLHGIKIALQCMPSTVPS